MADVLACAIGGFLGTVLIIPLRKYFVKELHGDFPFPEATAINEILVSGESTSRSRQGAADRLRARRDLRLCCRGVPYVEPEHETQTLFGDLGKKMSSIRLDMSMDGNAALFGLGYIIGLRYAAVIAAGSVFAYLVLTPLIYLVGSQIPDFAYAGNHYEIAKMSSKAIFSEFVKPIGIGAIAVSGIMGIIRMGKIVLGSILLGFKGLKGGVVEAAPPRRQTCLPATCCSSKSARRF